MAWNRAGQVGPQLNTVAEWTAEIGTGALPTISSTKKHLPEQTYSLRDAGGSDARSAGLTFASANQVRAGVWLNHNGLGTTSSSGAVIFRWVSSVGNTNYIRWKGNTGLLEIVLNGSVVASVAIGSAGLSVVDTWYHVGLFLETSLTVGAVTVYVNGVAVLSASGQNTGTSITALYHAGSAAGQISWATFAYFNDFYVDTGSDNANEAPPQKSFLWAVANGNGYASQWAGNDGNSVDNYLLVDDVTPDGDTTYVKALAVDLVDSYAGANLIVPAGYSIVAAIPTALAKRAGVSEQLVLGTYDGALSNLGSAKVPPASYGPLWARFMTQPNGSAYTEAAFNASEFLIKSAGVI